MVRWWRISMFLKKRPCARDQKNTSVSFFAHVESAHVSFCARAKQSRASQTQTNSNSLAFAIKRIRNQKADQSSAPNNPSAEIFRPHVSPTTLAAKSGAEERAGASLSTMSNQPQQRQVCMLVANFDRAPLTPLVVVFVVCPDNANGRRRPAFRSPRRRRGAYEQQRWAKFQTAENQRRPSEWSQCEGRRSE